MKFKVYEQTLAADGFQTKVASDSVGFVRCVFRFSPEWAGLTCVAQFTQNGATYNLLLDEAGTCLLPGELVAGEVAVSVFGQVADQVVRATTVPYCLHIHQSGFVGDGETPIPPTPDLYAQLLEQVREAVDGIPYEGTYRITPSADATQVLDTNGKTLTDDIVVSPVPSYSVGNGYGTTMTIAGKL